MRYLLLFLLPLSLFASKILSYNIYDRTDRADVMITFDTPYHGSIKQSTTNTKIIIKLEDAQIESSKVKKVSSKFLQQLTITPMKGYTQITATIPSNIKLVASKTSDAYGLRLRFVSKTISTNQKTTNQTTALSPTANLPTKKSDELSSSYYIVVSILIIGIIILLIIKKKTQAPIMAKSKDSWLFKPNTDQVKPNIQEQNLNNSNDMVSILFQKQINETNTVVMLSFMSESYLVLMGNSNILLDKFHDEKPSSQQEFETILQDRNEQLEEFLSSSAYREEKVKPLTPNDPLQAYTERAASIAYGEN